MDNKSVNTVIGKYSITYNYSESFFRYRITGDEDKWAESSGYAVIYCEVHLGDVYIGDFYIHKAEIEQYIGDEDINFQSSDFDGFKIVDNMIKTGWFEGYFLNQFEGSYTTKLMASNIVRTSLEILFNINHTINLLESVGITIDGSISDSSIGSDLYESSTAAYQIIEYTLNVGSDKVTEIAEMVEEMYKEYRLSTDYDVNKDQIIEDCLNNLMRLYKEE